jgi:2-aminoadipate transaminase
MNPLFADRIIDVPKSFIREMLKITSDPTIISFAGGLPKRDLFPAQELAAATDEVFKVYGRDVFQYSSSEGYQALREYIANNYRKKDLQVSAKNVLITSGSQQGLDLLGKVFLNDGDGVIIEEPGYLGAIQAFSLYRPSFSPVSVSEEGMDIEQLQATLTEREHKLLYAVPNFQNPSGISYSVKNREEVAKLVKEKELFIVEDDPYGELRFSGTAKPSFKAYLPEQTILLGSFSKIVVPGFRIGWVVAPDTIYEKLLIAKQASDLHTCHFTQYIIYQYLQKNSIESHLEKVSQTYGDQCQCMMESIDAYFPDNVKYTKPEGGMFLWVTLPKGISAMDLFDIAVKEKVAFVPGDPFYVNRKRSNTLRLNFSSVDNDTIKTGIQRLGKVIARLQG